MEHRLGTRKVFVRNFWIAIDPNTNLNEAVAVAQSEETLLALLSDEQKENCEIAQIGTTKAEIKAPEGTGSIVIFITCKECGREFTHTLTREKDKEYSHLYVNRICEVCSHDVLRDHFDLCPYEAYEFDDNGIASFVYQCGLPWEHTGKCEPMHTKKNFESEMQRIAEIRRERRAAQQPD